MVLLAASAGPSAYWYLSRATGAVALLLLTVSVVLGVLGPLRISGGKRWPRFAIDMLHRDVSLGVMVLLVLHVITSVLDGFAPIALLDSVIPWGSSYRPLWMGLGALSFDLLIAVVITSLLRTRLGYRWWRGIHWLAYASWPVGVLHGLGTGSDVKSWWMLALTFTCVVTVLVAVLVRINRSDPGRAAVRAGTLALAAATPLGIAAFTVAGPLASGWPRRAGTPASLLPHSAALAPPTVPARSASGSLDHPFTAALSGTVSQDQQAAGAVIQLSLDLHGQVSGRLRVRLGGAPLAGGGLSLTGSQVDLSAVGMRSVLDGRVVSLQGDRFVARVSDPVGLTVELRAALSINSGNETVTGTLSGQPLGAGK